MIYLKINDDNHMVLYEHAIKFVTYTSEKWIITLTSGEEFEVNLSDILYNSDCANFGDILSGLKHFKSFCNNKK